MTIIRLSTVKIIPIYAKVSHSELVPSELELASATYILCNIKFATSVLMCLCLQNRWMTKVVDIIEIIEGNKYCNMLLTLTYISLILCLGHILFSCMHKYNQNLI